jgi:hypothetical protein
MANKEKKLSDKEWNDLVRGFLKKLAKSATPKRGDAVKASHAINKTVGTIGDMKVRAKGSVVSWFRLAMFKVGIPDEEAKKLLQDPEALIQKIEKLGPPDIIDELLAEVLKVYSKNEVIAWLKLLLTKAHVEESLGLKPSLENKKK